jgi:16S rRNA G966 N2-methylase RsmD
VFADPPYALPYPAETFGRLRERGVVDAQTLIVYEHSSAVDAPADGRFEVVRTARYGAVALAFLKVAA